MRQFSTAVKKGPEPEIWPYKMVLTSIFYLSSKKFRWHRAEGTRQAPWTSGPEGIFRSAG